MSAERVHLYVSGRVQGVCYRAETRAAANRIGGVTGWVRNLPDGRVEVTAEGERAKIEELIAWCRKGPSWAEVTGVDADWRPHRGEFDSFEVTW